MAALDAAPVTGPEEQSDHPDVRLTLTTEGEGIQRGDYVVTARWEVHDGRGRVSTAIPSDARFTVRYGTGFSGTAGTTGGVRTFRLGAPSPVGKVMPITGAVQLVFRAEIAGRASVRAEGTVHVRGMAIRRAAESRIYIRRSTV